MRPRYVSLAASVALVCALPSAAFAKNEQTWATISDVGAYGLVAVSIGTPMVKGDENGALQAGGSVAAATLISQGLKEAFPELRPDRSDRKSFPSGHTANAFAAAASLYNRQGAAVGIPAMAVATLVGVARVQADKHHWYDVVAGGAVGLTTGFLITRDRPDRKTALVPWGDSKGGGISFAMRF